MRLLSFIFTLFVLNISLHAQSKTVDIQAAAEKVQQAKQSNFAGISAKNIGPTVQSGRVVDIAVNPNKPTEFYVAYASGGLWKTENNGNSFTPLFQQEMTMTIGAIDVNWKTGEVWIGSGEVNSSRSSYAGLGVFHSADWGKTWTHKGLPESHHIGKIFEAKSTGYIYVAVLGHLYTDNPERGVYRSKDRGTSWEQVLSISDNTGCVDLIQDLKDPNVFYAAVWERSRKAWNFVEAGKASAIYKSTNAGDSWERITVAGSGFPYHDQVGRIGLSQGLDGDKTVLYALLDNYNRRPSTKKKSKQLDKDKLRNMSKSDFLKLKDDQIQDYLTAQNFPKKYKLAQIREMIKTGKIQVVDLVHYVEDANKLLFDTPVIGAELYKSKDGGRSWIKTNQDNLEQLYNSYGYYFGLVRTVIDQPDIVYIGGVPLLKSTDGGKTFEHVNSSNVHADHHALWINPKDPNHYIDGNDGGINISYDGGANHFKCNSPSVGQFYHVATDNKKSYQVYGGMQDNGVWVGPNRYTASDRWHSTGHYPYKSIMGGDGMQTVIDNRDNETIYTGYQFGNYYRINESKNEFEYITPKHELGDRPYRWNWQSPIVLSSHNQDIVYFGCNKLMRSFDQGNNFTAISKDLTKGGIKGDVAYGTLTSISESELKFGLIYTGSDDGLVYRTDDGGSSWHKITDGLPADRWVSRVVASAHDLNTVYVALNGYRNDDFQSYVYKSTNRGASWQAIGKNLPMEPVNVIKEDPHHANILYVGTDNGAYISTNTGKQFEYLSKDVPFVAVHDLCVQKRDKDLLLGTHGRSIYKIDLSPIYDQTNRKDEALVAKRSIKTRASRRWGNKNWKGIINEGTFNTYLYSKQAGTVAYEIRTEDDKLLKSGNFTVSKGFNNVELAYHIDKNKAKYLEKYLERSAPLAPRANDKIYLEAGTYRIVYSLAGNKTETKLILK